MTDVKVYSTKACQYCRLLKAFLDRHNISYKSIDVGEDQNAAKEMIELTGQYGVPVTVIDGEVIIGFDTERLNEIFGSGDAPDTYDVLVIGGGPAGLTAAMYCSRKFLSCMIITENIGGQALESWSVENYMGFRVVTGGDLMQKFEEQIKTSDVRIELGSVTGIVDEDKIFTVDTSSNKRFRGKAVILTSGAKPRWLGVENEDKFIGRGISVCATCDGPLYRGKDVAIVGGGNHALTTAIEMSKIAKDVSLIVRSKIRADETYIKQLENINNIRIYKNYVVSKISGDKSLESVVIKERDTNEEKELKITGMFIAAGNTPNTDFLDGFIELNNSGEIVTDKNGRTSRTGIFAAGDVTDVEGKQIIIAAGEGAKAALSAYTYLVSQ
ncbi:FAD-dependent oxidoreductase [Methanomicrobium antiquum]|uniref:FAD-dependent oxidoreductase n=1 Tax=Methanomicrobium antiquum TaxID=487686 RepID=A0AAF0FUS6_9EURY|nr:FAD-dependent oxidoreductase [Methanomicrobium antiquum]MDD3976759.1 FAD-dependent oxidoreductase [Methanomicrobium sp.]WFN36878.1 FAD-dependent oxidoreductase [Methanomicrobium antiquum]